MRANTQRTNTRSEKTLVTTRVSSGLISTRILPSTVDNTLNTTMKMNSTRLWLA